MSTRLSRTGLQHPAYRSPGASKSRLTWLRAHASRVALPIKTPAGAFPASPPTHEPFHKVTLAKAPVFQEHSPRQRAMLVSSVHCPGCNPNGPPASCPPEEGTCLLAGTRRLSRWHRQLLAKALPFTRINSGRLTCPKPSHASTEWNPWKFFDKPDAGVNGCTHQRGS